MCKPVARKSRERRAGEKRGGSAFGRSPSFSPFSLSLCLSSFHFFKFFSWLCCLFICFPWAILSDTGSTPRTQPCYLFFDSFCCFIFSFSCRLENFFIWLTANVETNKNVDFMERTHFLTAALSWLDAVIWGKKCRKLPTAKPQVQYRKE